LCWIVNGSMQANTVPERDLAALRALKDWIETHTGIYYRHESQYILYCRLIQLCLKLNFKGLEALLQELRSGQNPQLSLSIAQYVSTTHTHFFREPESLDYFEQHILPEIRQNGQVRIWSTASSSGEEAYSLAICLAEKYGLQTVVNNFQILGTDINAHVIRHAELGIYHSDRMNDIPPALKEKYFKAVGMNQYQILPELRQICTFRRFNLQSEEWPFRNKFHVSFCRNVLYYFQKQQQNQVINKIYDHISPQGYLITSVTESLSQMITPWVMLRPAIYQKQV